MEYKELTHKIIGAAMEVHKHLGNGFQEVVYQRALAIEMHLQNIPFVREQEMQLLYKGNDIGTRRVDFFVDDKIMVEIKAIINLEDVHLAQAMNYVEAYNLEIGLLINFGAKSLQFKRVHNNKVSKSLDHNQVSNHDLKGFVDYPDSNNPKKSINQVLNHDLQGLMDDSDSNNPKKSSNRVLNRDLQGLMDDSDSNNSKKSSNQVLNHDLHGFKDYPDFNNPKKSSNHANQKNQGSDK